jgi:hypothetical protein
MRKPRNSYMKIQQILKAKTNAETLTQRQTGTQAHT